MIPIPNLITPGCGSEIDSQTETTYKSYTTGEENWDQGGYSNLTENRSSSSFVPARVRYISYLIFYYPILNNMGIFDKTEIYRMKITLVIVILFDAIRLLQGYSIFGVSNIITLIGGSVLVFIIVFIIVSVIHAWIQDREKKTI